MSMQVELVSPERILWSGQADMVICRTLGGGDIAFLPGHAPFVGALGTGVLTVRPTEGGDDEKVAVHGGFVEVSSSGEDGGTVVTVLSDVAELSANIDVERARAAKERHEAAMRADGDKEADLALRRAEVRLEAAGHTAAAH